MLKYKKDETLASLTNKCDVLMQTLVVLVRGDNNRIRRARVLIDTASQRSYISSTLANEMGYKTSNEEMISHSLFGDVSTGVIKHSVFKVHLSSLDKKYSFNFEALGQDWICGVISPVAYGPWVQELSDDNITLSDIGLPDPIEILIGVDIAGKLLTGKCKQLKSGLVAIETKLDGKGSK